MKKRHYGILIIALSLPIMVLQLLPSPPMSPAGAVASVASFIVALFTFILGVAYVAQEDKPPMRMWRVDYFCPEESLAAFTCLINCRHRPTEAEVIKVMNVTFEPDKFETITITEAIAERTL